MNSSADVRAVSVVIPVRDEEGSLMRLIEEIVEVGLPTECDLEIIMIDDGSKDRSTALIQGLAAKHSFIRAYRFDPGRGKSAAWELGFQQASKDVVVTFDADLQNDPRDILPMVEALGDDFDLVAGRRRKRADTVWRKIQSRIANHVRRTLLGDTALDSGCGFKAFRRECAGRIPMFNGAHRFMNALFQIQGCRATQVLIKDRPRVAGKPHFGFRNRGIRPFFDMLGVMWLKRRAHRIDHEPLEPKAEDQ